MCEGSEPGRPVTPPVSREARGFPCSAPPGFRATVATRHPVVHRDGRPRGAEHGETVRQEARPGTQEQRRPVLLIVGRPEIANIGSLQQHLERLAMQIPKPRRGIRNHSNAHTCSHSPPGDSNSGASTSGQSRLTNLPPVRLLGKFHPA